jgi:hypothetical protein
MAYAHIIENLLSLPFALERAQELVLTLEELYRMDLEYHHEDDETLPLLELYAYDSFHFLKCCVEQRVVNPAVIAHVEAQIQDLEEDYTYHVTYLKTVYAYLNIAYATL